MSKDIQTMTGGTMNPEPDERLVAQAVAGNSASFCVLVERYFGQVYAIAYARLQNREAAEELAQDVFVRGYLYLGKLSDPPRFSHWISRIARNLSLNWVRDQRRHSEVVRMIPLDGLPEEPRDTKASPRDTAATAQFERWVEEAVATLPADLREAVLLYYFEQVPKAHIAQLQGVNPSTLGRRIDQAVAQLQQKAADHAMTETKLQWKPQKAARSAATIITAAALLTPQAKAALLSKTADTVLLAATTKGGVAVSTSLFPKAGAVMISKTGASFIVASVVMVGALAIPGVRHRIVAPATQQVESPDPGARNGSKSFASFASRGTATGSAKHVATTKPVRPSNASPTGSAVTLPSESATSGPLDSGTQEVDPAAVTTATVTVHVLDEERKPIAGAKVSGIGARLAEDPRTWNFSSPAATTDEKGQVSLVVLESLDKVPVSELLLTANHPTYSPSYMAHVPFSLKPEVILKKDKDPKQMLRVHVHDELGKPIEGVMVEGHGLRESKTPSTGYGWIGVAVKPSTNADGVALIPYPEKISWVDEKVTTVIVGLYHPEYTNRREELPVNPADQDVVLRKGTDVVVSGYINNPAELVSDIHVQIDDGAGTASSWDGGSDGWEKLDNTHVHNRKIKAGTRALYAWADVQGTKYFSDLVALEVGAPHSPGAVQLLELNIPLKPALHVRGKLSDNVPRPVLNGQVKWEMPNTEIKGYVELWERNRALTLTHSGSGKIEADGTFDLGAVPPGKLEIAGLCNGWRNKDGVSLDESVHKPSVLPQVFTLDAEHTAITLDMEETAVFKATVLKPNGEPLQGATFWFGPNVFFLNYSTGFIRQSGWNANTDSAGNIVIPDLPGGQDNRLFFTSPGDEWELPEELKKDHGRVEMEAGKVKQMVIKLVPRPPGSGKPVM